MGTKITLPLLIFFFTTIGIAQTRKQIQGKISVFDASPSNVLILNLSTKQEVKSDSKGLFVILAQPEDVLIFSSPYLDYMRKIVETLDFQIATITIEMTSKVTFLEEVEIKKYNAVDLGILQRPAKSYTVMERRLKTAGDFKPIHLLGLLGGSIEVDPIINAINGKTKRLKKEIALERNRKRLEEFYLFYPKEKLISEIKINPDQMIEFTYFILEKEEFKTILENREKSKMTFYLIQQYSQFKSKQNEND